MRLQLAPTEVDRESQRDKLIASMKTTAINRYNASNRLAWQGKVTFAASTLISLGLIFIPLIQLAKIPLHLSSDVLGAIQIFLAVAILVYSIVIGTARYELRSEQLNDCGDKIKQLIRELRVAHQGSEEEEIPLLRDYQQRYAEIISDVENHERNDYILTILRTRDLFKLTFAGRIVHWARYSLSALVPYLPSIALIIVELLLITDMFGATTVFSAYLQGTAAAQG